MKVTKIFIGFFTVCILSVYSTGWSDLSQFEGPPINQLWKSDVSIVGNQGGDKSGFSIAGRGDIDGDGYEDVLITAPYANKGRGETYIFLGKNIPKSGTFSINKADYILVGGDPDDHSGWSACFIKDIEGDNKDEIVISAPYAAADDRGLVYIVLSSSLIKKSHQSSLFFADYILMAPAVNDHAGWCVSSGGDMDADGKGDLVIGTNGGSYTTQIYLLYGKTIHSKLKKGTKVPEYLNQVSDYVFATQTISSQIGPHTVYIDHGNIDGDKHSDLVIGATTATTGTAAGDLERLCHVHVILGSEIVNLTKKWNDLKSIARASYVDRPYAMKNTDWKLYRDGIENYFPTVAVGDIDGDKLDDIAMGWFLKDGKAGDVHVAFGKNIPKTKKVFMLPQYMHYKGIFNGKGNNHQIGREIKISDLDNDGYGELIVSCQTFDNRGITYVFSGKNVATASLPLGLSDNYIAYFLEGEFSGDHATALGISDINKDGIDDLVIGAMQHSTKLDSNVGKSYIILGYKLPAPPSAPPSFPRLLTDPPEHRFTYLFPTPEPDPLLRVVFIVNDPEKGEVWMEEVIPESELIHFEENENIHIQEVMPFIEDEFMNEEEMMQEDMMRHEEEMFSEEQMLEAERR